MRHAIPILLFGLLAAQAAWAQDAEQAPAGAEPEPTLVAPPKLEQLVPAEIPPGTVFPAPEVVILLEIDVSESGQVEQVRVREGAGTPFDEAAVAAARQFRFSPARLSNGESAPVTITFRMRIQQPPPEPPPPRVVFGGQLLERGTRKPLPGVEVLARELALPEGEKLAEDRALPPEWLGAVLAESASDDQGRFSLEVPATEFAISAFPARHERLGALVRAEAGEEREEIFYLEETPGAFETVVRAERTRREVTRQVIPRDVVLKVAGTQGDTLKVVQNLPGVARAPFGAGTLILRGASPGDSRVFLEGQEIPSLYHFGGLRSTFHSAFLESVEFLPGNFGPDYGRAMGGVVEVRVRDPARDAFRGQVDINFYDAGFALEGPLSEDWSIGGAFHRSWIDAILPAVLPDDAPLSFNTAPRYYDYQLLTTWEPDSRQKLRIMGYGSMDKVELLFDRPAGDPLIRGDLAVRIMFHNLYASYRRRLLDELQQETSFQLGLQRFDTQIGPELFFNLQTVNFTFRSTWAYETFDWLELRAGLDILVQGVDIDLNSSLRPIEGETGAPTSTQQRYAYTSSATIYQPAFFVEARVTPLEGLSILPSLRVDYTRGNRAWSLDPRLMARYEVVPGTVVKGGLGYYHQPPTADQTVGDLGNPDLLQPRSSHSSLGVEQKIFDYLDVELSGFYKWLDQQVIRNPLFFADPSQPPYLSGGTGRILGLELLVKGRYAGFSGWLAYTFQRSYRKDGPGAEERLFDYDQPHILTLVGSYDFGAGWSAGLRFRFVSGSPYTPVTGSIYDAGADSFVPIYGQVNSARLGAFHQLDLRVDKVWAFELWKLGVYLDVQNVYYHQNQEGVSYSYDYRDSQITSGLPILPILGVKGEW
ncbi:MAG: TonB family protein [Deltaproteobacteria bacterium]|nr:TonB family protein [Deltaproteobacteria bacterium]